MIRLCAGKKNAARDAAREAKRARIAAARAAKAKVR
jgi:hypothetical protein